MSVSNRRSDLFGVFASDRQLSHPRRTRLTMPATRIIAGIRIGEFTSRLVSVDPRLGSWIVQRPLRMIFCPTPVNRGSDAAERFRSDRFLLRWRSDSEAPSAVVGRLPSRRSTQLGEGIVNAS